MVHLGRKFSTTIFPLCFSQHATAIVVIDPNFEARIGERSSFMFAFAHILKKHTFYHHCVLNSP